MWESEESLLKYMFDRNILKHMKTQRTEVLTSISGTTVQRHNPAIPDTNRKQE